MPDIIRLLPDAVANQIAAGEVVQRPASVVKELLENSVDAGATSIELIIKNAGKSLIQVVDNGSGMTETDARLSLERHATSKITDVNDLFSLKTMGFRGEAVPSIAAVSQMEIKTRTEAQELGSHLLLEGSKVISQEFCQCPKGTNICVKNLFFNIPARRNFLKSNPVEQRHIMDEFMRVALINPQVAMSMRSESGEVYQLPASNFRQRIVNLFGSKYNQRLVPVQEKTDIVNISGFVGKPEFARKTRGEQYFFVNGRFIKSPYFNHAVQIAFEELLASDHFPSYFLQMQVDPSKIDINIHPTKTEVKFEEERAIYAIIRTAIRQALGKYNIAPSLDFEQEKSFEVPVLKKGEGFRMPSIQIDPEYNPFEKEKTANQNPIRFPYQREKPQSHWESLYQAPEQTAPPKSQTELETFESRQEVKLMQLHGRYILSQLKNGFLLIDQQRAHERILIERYSEAVHKQQQGSQQLLFPEELELSASDYQLVQEIAGELKLLGFSWENFGSHSLMIQGIPEGVEEKQPVVLLEKTLELFKENRDKVQNRPLIALIYSLAKSASIKRGKLLSQLEMSTLIDELFACEMPYSLPNKKPIIITYSLEELNKQFNYS